MVKYKSQTLRPDNFIITNYYLLITNQLSNLQNRVSDHSFGNLNLNFIPNSPAQK